MCQWSVFNFKHVVTIILFVFIESEGCVNGSLRLIGGNTMLEGILQICIDGVWGVICNRLTTKEMSIACAQMGFTFSGC